jgi:hypothetical protein
MRAVRRENMHLGIQVKKNPVAVRAVNFTAPGYGDHFIVGLDAAGEIAWVAFMRAPGVEPSRVVRPDGPALRLTPTTVEPADNGSETLGRSRPDPSTSEPSGDASSGAAG